MTALAMHDDALDENLIALLYDAASGLVSWSQWGEVLCRRASAARVVVRAFGQEVDAQSSLDLLDSDVGTVSTSYVATDSSVAIEIMSPAGSLFLARSVLSMLGPHVERLARLRTLSEVASVDADVVCDEFGFVRSGGAATIEVLRELGCAVAGQGARLDLSKGRPPLAEALRRAQLGYGRALCVVDSGSVRREITVELDEPSALAPKYRGAKAVRLRVRDGAFDAEFAVRCLVGLGARYTDARIAVAEIYDLRELPADGRRAVSSSAIRGALDRAMRAVGVRDVDELAFVLGAARLGERWRIEFET